MLSMFCLVVSIVLSALITISAFCDGDVGNNSKWLKITLLWFIAATVAHFTGY